LAYYDPNLDITWAADADINGLDTWDNQITWVANLTIGGVGGWRLPSADVNGDGTVVDCFGGGVTACGDNEMGYLYWEEGITPSTTGPFSNIHTTSSTSSWILRFSFGDQRTFNKISDFPAWAVRNGDISSVPVPAAVWLFGSGLLSLIGLAKRKVA